MLFEKVARRYIESRQHQLEKFKNTVDVIDEYMTVKKVAEDMFGRPLGQGTEAMVFRLGSSDKVLKISHKSPNLRAEYVIFIDPQFQDVTPEVYDHGEDWRWITVEKVEPLRHREWGKVWEHLPEFEEKGEREITYSGGDYTLGALPNDTFKWVLQLDEEPDWFKGLPKNEKEWFRQVKRLYSKLGKEPKDVRPVNMGIDTEGNLVVLDLFVQEDF